MIFNSALSILLLCCCIHARSIRDVNEKNGEIDLNIVNDEVEETSEEDENDVWMTLNQRRLLYLDDGSHIMKINERQRDTLFQGMVKVFLKGFRWVRELVKLVREDSTPDN